MDTIWQEVAVRMAAFNWQEVAMAFAALSWQEMASAVVAMLLGLLVFSATGFGIGMVATPVLLLAHEPQSAIVIPATLGWVMGLWIMYKSWRDVPLRDILPVSIASLFGAPFGVYILSTADSSVLSIAIAALIILFAIGSFFKVEKEIPYSKPVGILAGLVVGVLLPTTGVAGSLVMLYLMTKQWERHTVRAAMAFFLVMLMTFSIALFWWWGLFTPERIALSGIAVIPAAIGVALGAILIKRINEQVFQYAVIGIIIFSSVIAIGLELSKL